MHKFRSKTLVSLALALVLAFGAVPLFGLTAQAAVDWDDFYIITEPQKHTIQRGETITLSVEVNVPDGVVVEYQWYRQLGSAAHLIENATTPVLRVDPNSSHYPSFILGRSRISQNNYWCSIIARDPDAGAYLVSSKTLKSQTATVKVEDNSSWAKFLSLTIDPFIMAFVMSGIILPLLPFVFPFALIMMYIEAFKNL